MAHPFEGKPVVFIGRPERFTRKEARNELLMVGGLPEEKITSKTRFVVAFKDTEGTKAYQSAIEHSRSLTILTEEQFAEMLTDGNNDDC